MSAVVSALRIATRVADLDWGTAPL
jgi:hypothetical protein